MRRERIIALLAVLTTVFGVTLLAPGTAGAATPQQICNDLLVNGHATQDYSGADLQSYFTAQSGGDPAIQGYCPPFTPLTRQTPPPPPECVEVAAGTNGAVQAQNGKWFANAPNQNAEACTTPPAPCTMVPANTPGATQASNGTWYANTGGNPNACAATVTPPCTEVAAGTAGAKQAANGKWFVNAPSGNAESCTTPPAPCTMLTGAAPGATQASNGTWFANAPGGNAEACVHHPNSVVVVPTAGVKGATKVKKSSPAPAATAPAQHSAAPLATTRSTGTLPFTGTELALFVIVGLALLGGGLLLRTTAGTKRKGI